MIKSVHHIGISVADLNRVARFYKEGAGLEVAAQFEIEGNEAVDRGVQQEGVSCKAVLLNGRTTFLELLQFEHPKREETAVMPVNGPGITHICFHSPAANPSFETFGQAGMRMESRGDTPVKLSSRGITYAYARDVEGNLFEMEQWEEPRRPYSTWIAHVALVSPNIERLSRFYAELLLGMDSTPEIRRIHGIPNLDVVANLDDVDLWGTWLPTANILLELWQYVNPPTPQPIAPRPIEQLGYNKICFEVDDIQAEFERLTGLGVPFLSEPFRFGQQLMVYGRDPDGNLFELIQFLDDGAPLTLAQLNMKGEK